MTLTETSVAVRIKLGTERAYKLAQEIPEIADDYKNGLTRREIVRKYGLANKISEVAAMRIVRGALEGNHDERRGLEFDGLLDEEELREIGQKHINKNIENLSEKKGAWKSVGGINSAIARGDAVWTDGETLCAYLFSKSDLTYEESAKELNSLWGNSRAPGSVAVRVSLHRRRKGNITIRRTPWQDGEILCAYLLSQTLTYKQATEELNSLWGNSRTQNSVEVGVSNFRRGKFPVKPGYITQTTFDSTRSSIPTAAS